MHASRKTWRQSFCQIGKPLRVLVRLKYGKRQISPSNIKSLFRLYLMSFCALIALIFFLQNTYALPIGSITDIQDKNSVQENCEKKKPAPLGPINPDDHAGPQLSPFRELHISYNNNDMQFFFSIRKDRDMSNFLIFYNSYNTS